MRGVSSARGSTGALKNRLDPPGGDHLETLDLAERSCEVVGDDKAGQVQVRVAGQVLEGEDGHPMGDQIDSIAWHVAPRHAGHRQQDDRPRDEELAGEP